MPFRSTRNRRLVVNERKESLLVLTQTHPRPESTLLNFAQRVKLREAIYTNPDVEGGVKLIEWKLEALKNCKIVSRFEYPPLDRYGDFPSFLSFIQEARRDRDIRIASNAPLYYLPLLKHCVTRLIGMGAMMRILRYNITDVIEVAAREFEHCVTARLRNPCWSREDKKMFKRLKKRLRSMYKFIGNKIKRVDEAYSVIEKLDHYPAYLRGRVLAGLGQYVLVVSGYFVYIFELLLSICGLMCRKILKFNEKVKEFSLAGERLEN